MVLSRVLQNVGNGPINLSVATPTLLVSQPTRVTNAGDHQTMFDIGDPGLIAREPGDRPNGTGDEQKAIGIARWRFTQVPRQKRGEREARKIVVGQRRMAGMTGNKNFIRTLPTQEEFAIRELAVLQR